MWGTWGWLARTYAHKLGFVIETNDRAKHYQWKTTLTLVLVPNEGTANRTREPTQPNTHTKTQTNIPNRKQRLRTKKHGKTSVYTYNNGLVGET